MPDIELDQTFRGTIEIFKRWAKLRLNEDDAIKLMVSYLLAHQNPGEYSEIMSLWQGCFDVQRRITVRLENNNWSDMSGDAFQLLSVGSFEVGKAIENFLPWPVKTKQTLWDWHCLNRGRQDNPKDPYCYFYPMAFFSMAWPYVFREMVEREMKNPEAFAYGMIGYSRRTGDDKLPGAHDIIAEATELISRFIKKKLPWDACEFLAERANYGSKTLVGEYVEKALFRLRATPDEIMAKALEPRAKQQSRIAASVINTIRDEQRDEIPGAIKRLLREKRDLKSKAKSSRKITLKEYQRLEDIDEEIDEIRHQIASAALKELAADDASAEMKEALKSALSTLQDQEQRELLEEYLQGFSQKEMAEKRRVTEPVITKRMKNAFAGLRKTLEIE